MVTDGKTGHPEQPLKPITNSARIDAVLRAIEEFDIVESDAWSQLDGLSSRTEVQSVEANPDGIFESPDETFQVIGSVYLTLNYGNKRDSVSMSDSYPFHMFGHFLPEGEACVDRIEVDTSSFDA